MISDKEVTERKLQAIIRAQDLQIESLKSALKVIRTWVSYDEGKCIDVFLVEKLLKGFLIAMFLGRRRTNEPNIPRNLYPPEMQDKGADA